jgi:hypothetical protein
MTDSVFSALSKAIFNPQKFVRGQDEWYLPVLEEFAQALQAASEGDVEARVGWQGFHIKVWLWPTSLASHKVEALSFSVTDKDGDLVLLNPGVEGSTLDTPQELTRFLLSRLQESLTNTCRKVAAESQNDNTLVKGVLHLKEHDSNWPGSLTIKEFRRLQATPVGKHVEIFGRIDLNIDWKEAEVFERSTIQGYFDPTRFKVLRVVDVYKGKFKILCERLHDRD